MQSEQTVGIVLVDHGSTRKAANDLLLDVAALYQRVTGAPIVEPAHMELAEPTIQQAFDRCVEQGATLVVIHPYFLAHGKHVTSDIPRLSACAASHHPGVRFHVSEPLGLDEKLALLVHERVQHCIEHNFECDACRDKAGCGAPTAPLSSAA